MSLRQRANHDPDRPSRRNVLAWVWWFLGGIAAVEMVWVIGDFFKPRRRTQVNENERSLIVAGPVDRFEPGSVTAFPEGRFYLVRLEDGGFLALDRRCTHLGCTVPWIDSEQRFVCPCHASSFDMRGEVSSPPAPRALDLFAIRIENGIVKVDVASPIRRGAFSDTQVTRS